MQVLNFPNSEIKFPTVLFSENKLLNFFLVGRTIVLVIIPLFVFLFLQKTPVKGGFDFTILFIWIALAIFFGLSPFFIHKIKSLRNFELFDEIAFDNTGIILFSKKFLYSNIGDLTFYYGGFDGENLQFKRRFAEFSEGISSISFTSQSEAITTNFFLENESQKERLENLFGIFYMSGIIFMENNLQGRTYMLQNLKPEEETEFREKFHLTN